jgi:chaperonin cofactor prefoldin
METRRADWRMPLLEDRVCKLERETETLVQRVADLTERLQALESCLRDDLPEAIA